MLPHPAVAPQNILSSRDNGAFSFTLPAVPARGAQKYAFFYVVFGTQISPILLFLPWYHVKLAASQMGRKKCGFGRHAARKFGMPDICWKIGKI